MASLPSPRIPARSFDRFDEITDLVEKSSDLTLARHRRVRRGLGRLATDGVVLPKSPADEEYYGPAKRRMSLFGWNNRPRSLAIFLGFLDATRFL